MGYRYPSFIPIKPNGRAGDRKNDGYIPELGIFFQVYAPEKPDSSRTPRAAALKATHDFEGLKDGWTQPTPIREFRFAFNDKYRGTPHAIVDAVHGIATRHGIRATVFLAKDLENDAFALADDQILAVVGPVPASGLLPDVDFALLGEVVRYVIEHGPPPSTTSTLTAPDFDEKIAFNGLSPKVASLLTVASYQSEAVRDFFSLAVGERQRLRDRLATIYQDAKENPSAHGRADLIFFNILETISPPVAEHAALRQQAALVVMAYFFEACDIFEDPHAPS